jgi:hypothetical protein
VPGTLDNCNSLRGERAGHIGQTKHTRQGLNSYTYQSGEETMIDPNLYIFARAIHERRIEEALRRQQHWQPPENGWRLHRNFWIDTKSNIQETEESMIPFEMEFLGRERQQTFLQAAEQHRLLKRVTAQPANQATTIGQLRCWLGTQLVKWGFKLQGYRGTALPLPPQYEPLHGS